MLKIVESYVSTAVTATSQEANFARTEFERLLDNGLILSDELHLCYLVTPFRDLVTPDWAVFLAVCGMPGSTFRCAAKERRSI